MGYVLHRSGEKPWVPPGMEHLLERPMIPVLLRTVDELRLSEDDLRKLVDELYKNRGGKRK